MQLEELKVLKVHSIFSKSRTTNKDTIYLYKKKKQSCFLFKFDKTTITFFHCDYVNFIVLFIVIPSIFLLYCSLWFHQSYRHFKHTLWCQSKHVVNPNNMHLILETEWFCRSYRQFIQTYVLCLGKRVNVFKHMYFV